MALLPESFEAKGLNNQVFKYLDPVAMIEAMRRLRRELGWQARVPYHKEGVKSFMFVMATVEPDYPDDEDAPIPVFNYASATFSVLIKAVRQNLYQSLYPDVSGIHELRRWFFEPYGLQKIANMVNETPPNTPAAKPEASKWGVLLDSEDDL